MNTILKCEYFSFLGLFCEESAIYRNHCHHRNLLIFSPLLLVYKKKNLFGLRGTSHLKFGLIFRVLTKWIFRPNAWIWLVKTDSQLWVMEETVYLAKGELRLASCERWIAVWALLIYPCHYPSRKLAIFFPLICVGILGFQHIVH